MKFLKALAVAAALAVVGAASAGTAAVAAGTTPAAVKIESIDVSKPIPSTMSVKVGERLEVITFDAPGAPAVLGVKITDTPPPALMRLNFNTAGPQIYYVRHAGIVVLDITYSHNPSDPNATKHAIVTVTITP